MLAAQRFAASLQKVTNVQKWSFLVTHPGMTGIRAFQSFRREKKLRFYILKKVRKNLKSAVVQAFSEKGPFVTFCSVLSRFSS